MQSSRLWFAQQIFVNVHKSRPTLPQRTIFMSGFPTWAGNRAGRGGSDPITSPIKLKNSYQPDYQPLKKKITSPIKISGLVGVVIGLVVPDKGW